MFRNQNTDPDHMKYRTIAIEIIRAECLLDDAVSTSMEVKALRKHTNFLIFYESFVQVLNQ